MKGIITSIGAGLLWLLLWPNNPLLALIVPVLVAVVVLAFWTGAVGVRFERD